MEFVKLYSLIHRLTAEQRTQFKRYAKDRINDLTFELYRRILKTDSANRESEKNIQNPGFLNPKTYNHHRKKLSEWIIMSLVRFDSNGGFSKELVKEAFLYEADRFANELIENEIAKLHEEEDYSSLYGLLSFLSELQHHYDIKITKIELAKDLDFVERELREYAALNSFIADLRTAAHGTAQARKLTASRILEEMNDSYNSRQCSNLAIKVRMNCAYLLEDFNKAFRYGEEFIGRLASWPSKYPPSYRARQLRFFIMNAILLNQRDIAMKYGLRLNRIESAKPLEWNQIIRSKIIASVAIAAYFSECDFADNICIVLEENCDVFEDPKIPCIAYYNLGMAYSFSGQFKKAVTCFERSRSLRKKKFAILDWEPQVMLAIAHYNLGNVELIGYLMRSAIRAAKDLKHEYPKIATSLVKNVLLNDAPGKQMTGNGGIGRIKSLYSDAEEKHASRFFQIEFWLEADLRSVPVKDVLHESRAKQSPQIASIRIV